MRTTTLPLRSLRRAPSCLLNPSSSASPTLQPLRCASSSASQAAAPAPATTPKPVYTKPQRTPTSNPPAAISNKSMRPGSRKGSYTFNAMSVSDVDTSLPSLPSAPSSSSNNTTSPSSYPSPAAASEFVAAVQSTSPALQNGNGDNPGAIDWSTSFHGLSTVAFDTEVAKILMAPLNKEDVEIKPDGIAYLPEIKYRRILNTAFGPGGWGLAPRGELVVGEKVVTREYALVVHGRFVAQARGECQYFSEDTIPTAAEGCKSNALSRCCKDLGIASELWDPRYLRQFKKEQCREVWVEHVVSKKKRQIWTRKDTDPQYPYALAMRIGA
ncbi:mitochondrial genome maintenance MGM101-domain-containing protein [Coniochaeta sp. 2T2.1]|nr:mitochondrial genome maintenance MGM101-domain-containing protein [Coniochaeta sp. 2T2.1]